MKKGRKASVPGRSKLHVILTMLTVIGLFMVMTATAAAEEWVGDSIDTRDVILVGDTMRIKNYVSVNGIGFGALHSPYTLIKANYDSDTDKYIESDNGNKLLFLTKDGHPIGVTDISDHPYADGFIVTYRSVGRDGNEDIHIQVHDSKELEDKAKAKEAADKIDAIGTVTNTDECKAIIDAARAAYNNLTDEQKPYVTNYDTLTAAEERYKELNPHNVTVAASGNGEVRIQGSSDYSHAAIKEGDTVQLNVLPSQSYKLKSLYYVEDGSTEHVDITAYENSFYTFVMGEKDVTVYAEFTDIVCKVKADANMTNGTLRFYDEVNNLKDEFKAGERVIIEVVPDEGYVATGAPTSDRAIYPLPESKRFYFDMPFSKLPDEAVVSCNFAKLIKEVSLQVSTPCCGDGGTPRLGIPERAEYSLANEGEPYKSLNWLPEGQSNSTAYLTGGESYSARIYLKPADGCCFTEDTVVTVNETEVSSFDIQNNGQIKIISKPIKAFHAFNDKVEAKAATCTEAGNIEYWTCKFCRRYFTDIEGTKEVKLADTIIPATGHNWDEWKETKEPTKTEDGEEKRDCSGCDEEDSRAVPKTDHTHSLTLVKGKAAKCTESGQKAYYKCSGCDAIYEDPEGKVQTSLQGIKIPAKGHKPGDPEKREETPATSSTVGVIHLTTRCTECGAVLKEEQIITPFDYSAHDVGGNIYKELSESSVALVKAKNAKSVKVPATVKSGEKTFKVVQVDANAFTGKAIRTVTIGKNVKTIKTSAFKGSKATKLIVTTKKLTKKSVKGSLKGSKVKTVKVSLGKKSVNKKYVKKYKKIFTKKNAGKKVKVK